jgi:hypothetical protein
MIYTLVVLGFGFFAVFFASRNAAFVGAPLLPGDRISSPEPAAMRLRFLSMFLYNPGLPTI